MTSRQRAKVKADDAAAADGHPELRAQRSIGRKQSAAGGHWWLIWWGLPVLLLTTSIALQALLLVRSSWDAVQASPLGRFAPKCGKGQCYNPIQSHVCFPYQ